MLPLTIDKLAIEFHDASNPFGLEALELKIVNKSLPKRALQAQV